MSQGITARRGPAKSVRDFARQSPWAALTTVIAIFVLIPLVPLQTRAWADGASGIRQFLEMNDLGAVVRNTLLLGVGATLVGVVLGTTLALSVHAMSPRLQSWLSFTPVLPMIIPAVAHVVGFVFLFSPETGYANMLLRQLPFVDSDAAGPVNVYTPTWIILYTGFNLSSFVYLFVFNGLRNLGADYAQAARVNGASSARILFTVTLPMLRPVFTYASSVVLLLSVGQFTGPLILGRREGLDVLTTRMYELTADFPVNYELAAALGTPLLGIALVIIFLQRWTAGDQKRFVGRGAMSMDRAPATRTTSIIATTYVLLFTVLSAVLPLMALAYVSVSQFWTGKVSLKGMTLTHYHAAFESPALIEAMVTTLQVTGIGVLILVPIGLLIAIAQTLRDRIWKPVLMILEIATTLPLAVPAALIGFGFMFAFSAPGVGLYGTPLALIIAYVTIMLPYSVRYQLATLIALGNQTVESSRVSGAGPLRTFGQIILPLARGGIATSAAVMFVLLSHEFGVSLMLRSPDSTVMSVLLYDQFSAGSYPAVAVTATVMTVVTAVGVIAALLFGGTKAMERL